MAFRNPTASLLLLFLTVLSARASDGPSLSSLLEPIRAKYNLPALAGAIFTTDGLKEIGATGVRKVGTNVAVTTNDLWHIGSDTKAMTAMLLGTYVAQKKIAWTDRVASFFPEMADQMPSSMRNVTLADLLTHHAGLIENLDWYAFSKKDSPPQQRLAAVRQALTKPKYSPGMFHYSNTDYVVIGAVLDRIGGEPWEELMRERIFVPLQMYSAGFGGTGTPGKIDQPWPHNDDGSPNPTNGPDADLPKVLESAGAVHCTMRDWSKFLIDQLRGGSGLKALLLVDIYRAIQPAPPLDEQQESYGYGWGVYKREWAGNKALGHNGSNGCNYCVAWLAPERKFGILVCTNQGGEATAGKAVDEAADALIMRYLGK
jgi:CubicO group peptidase (beta-lactamase class C family)